MQTLGAVCFGYRRGRLYVEELHFYAAVSKQCGTTFKIDNTFLAGSCIAEWTLVPVPLVALERVV